MQTVEYDMAKEKSEEVMKMKEIAVPYITWNEVALRSSVSMLEFSDFVIKA